AGHISRVCPRKNTGAGKKRKTPTTVVPAPNLASTEPSSISASFLPEPNPPLPVVPEPESSIVVQSPPSVVSKSNAPNQLAPSRQSQRFFERQSSPEIQHHIFSQLSLPSTQAICNHCELSGHSRTNSKNCLKNPKYLAEFTSSSKSSPIEPSISDINMADSLPVSQLPDHAAFESGTDSLLGDQPSSQ
ncbi:hypothetical protein A0J61_11907, partial [Choanephora cucurbitarum]